MREADGGLWVPRAERINASNGGTQKGNPENVLSANRSAGGSRQVLD